jgi:hypothetical protein
MQVLNNIKITASNNGQTARPVIAQFINRRSILSTTAALILTPIVQQSAAAEPDIAAEGSCIDCIGVENDTLNACSLNVESCVSTYNDDEVHFVPPWEWTSPNKQSAIDQLLSVATGGDYEAGFDQVTNMDAAKFVVQGVAAVVANQPSFFPNRPQPKRRGFTTKFNATVQERKTTSGGSEYIRLTFPPSKETDKASTTTIDMELLFIDADNLVNIRAVSRGEPTGNGKLGLSMTRGIVLDKNEAREKAEELRRALGWDVAPVITDFDPQFNAEVPVVIEKIFSAKPNFTPSGEAYPTYPTQ